MLHPLVTQQNSMSASCPLAQATLVQADKTPFTYLLLLAGFTRSHFQHDVSLNSKPPEVTIPQHTVDTTSPTNTKDATSFLHDATTDMFAEVNSNSSWRYKNSLNNTHYMLYHAEAPPQHTAEPFTFGFLTTMARTEGKMRHKKPVTVTVIGGSVSAAYCKEPGIGCWVTPVTEWLVRENPQVSKKTLRCSQTIFFTFMFATPWSALHSISFSATWYFTHQPGDFLHWSDLS